MKKCGITVFIGLTVGVASAGTAGIHSATFPKTFDNVNFADRMEILTDDYNNYAELTPYQQLILDDAEWASHTEIDNINASECAKTGQACDNETPVSDGNTYEIATTNTDSESTTTPESPSNQEPQNNTEPIKPNQNTPNNTPQTATGYCSVRQPEIPQGQLIPLGSPVRFNDLPASASDKSKRIATDSKNGKFCSPYGCREKYNNRGSYRPHQGIDIGCNADFFGLPIYTPADGVVTQVAHAQRGKSAGNYIRIKHADGWETQYMHLEKIFVTKGQSVSAGCAIGLLGHSGGNADSRNPSMGKDISHLHYEVIYNGTASNVKTPNGRNIKIVRGGNRSCGNFKAKIKPDDFVTYYYK